MAQDSKIEWTEHTWNPVSGCTKISTGCKNCYAETIANRFWKDRKFTDVQTHSHKLMEPVKRKKPTTYFVNSMSDLFHEDVPFEFIDQVFAVMAATPQHTYQVLTKRPERMLGYMESLTRRMGGPSSWFDHIPQSIRDLLNQQKPAWPLPNVWLGVSVENQEQVNIRIPVLLQVPAKVRFLSCEPLLEEVDLSEWLFCERCSGPSKCGRGAYETPLDNAAGGCWFRECCCSEINWVIIGGESGSGARPCHIDWIRSLVEQCKDANVARFVKQLGSHSTCGHSESLNQTKISQLLGSNAKCLACGFTYPKDSKGGDIIEWPNDLQVREFPKL